MGDMIPIGRVGRPEDLVDMVAFLAGDMAAYITGQSINICGGLVTD
jgi:NAD(P)-dependent dehydrogenase (short-subunit alcohol dehydrogenase family)